MELVPFGKKGWAAKATKGRLLKANQSSIKGWALLEDGEILRSSTPVSVLQGPKTPECTGTSGTVEAVHITPRPCVLVAPGMVGNDGPLQHKWPKWRRKQLCTLNPLKSNMLSVKPA